MDRLKITGFFLVTAISVVFLSHRGLADTFNKVVAIVNEDVITLHELDEKIRELTGVTAEDFKAKDNGNYLKTRRKILDLLIDEKIAQSKIKELNLEVSPGEVDAAIEKIKNANKLTHAELMAKLKQGGINYEKYREKIKNDLERMKLINTEVKSKIILRNEQLLQYYKEHIKDYTTEEQVRLAGIFLNMKDPNDEAERRELSGKCEEILRRLGAGEDFGALAKRFSQGPGADENGDLGFFKTSQLEATLRKMLAEMPEGGIVEPVKGVDSIRIIKLTKREKAHVKPFESVKDEIYSVLYGNEMDRRYSSWIKELREGSYTKILF